MSREDVIRQIVDRDIHKQGLSEDAVVREAPELYTAACGFYGTWETALHYAGVSELRAINGKRRRSDKFHRTVMNSDCGPEAVVRAIRKLCVTGYDLSAARNLRRDRRLYEAARRHFGTWRQALVAAGINLDRAKLRGKPRKLAKEKLISQLRQRHEQGQSLAWHRICLEDRAFATAVRSAYGSWRPR